MTSLRDLKTFTKHRDPEHIANEVRFLTFMQDSGYVPRLVACGDDFLTLEHIENEPVTDADAFLVHCCGLLSALRERKIEHGDLTDRNILVRGNRPYAIDFAESRFDSEAKPSKRLGGDAPWLWRAYEGLTGDPRRHARRWLAIRERLNIAECKTVIDLGCNRGDIVLMAQAEGYDAAGMDYDAQDFIAPHIALGDVLGLRFTADALFLLSVFPYLARQAGWERITEWMGALTFRRLYVECQLSGDGPGLDQFRTKEDVARYLSAFGEVSEIVSIALPDRGAVRTTFEVAREL